MRKRGEEESAGRVEMSVRSDLRRKDACEGEKDGLQVSNETSYGPVMIIWWCSHKCSGLSKGVNTATAYLRSNTFGSGVGRVATCCQLDECKLVLTSSDLPNVHNELKMFYTQWYIYLFIWLGDTVVQWIAPCFCVESERGFSERPDVMQQSQNM